MARRLRLLPLALAVVMALCLTTTAAAQQQPQQPDPSCGTVVAALENMRRQEVSGKTVVSGDVVLLNRAASDRNAYAVLVTLDGATMDYPPIADVKVCSDVTIKGGAGAQPKATCAFSITAQGRYVVATARAYGLAPANNAKAACTARAFIA
jgi:hypothetical protein